MLLGSSTMALLFHGPSFESSTNALAVSAIVSILTSFVQNGFSRKLSFERHPWFWNFKGRPEVGRDDERDDDTIFAWQEDCCTRP